MMKFSPTASGRFPWGWPPPVWPIVWGATVVLEVVLQGVDPLVQQADRQTTENQRQRLGLRRPRPRGQGLRLDELEGNRASRLIDRAELRAEPLGKTRQPSRAEVHVACSALPWPDADPNLVTDSDSGAP